MKAGRVVINNDFAFKKLPFKKHYSNRHERRLTASSGPYYQHKTDRLNLLLHPGSP